MDSNGLFGLKVKLMNNKNILEITDLSMVYTTDGTDLSVLRDIDLEIQKGQVVGLVGESGSGKTSLGLAIMRYLPQDGKMTKGSIHLSSRDLLKLPKSELRSLWGKEISFVPQDPFSSLNPSIRIGEQLAEVFEANDKLSKEEARKLAIEWLTRVQLPDPDQIINKYPHELSGGQKQRLLVAMALSNHPKLLILDEPTTSLDVTTEAVVLELLSELIQMEGASALFITHNLGIVAGLADRVVVLYAGELVEDAPTSALYCQPLHPYTMGLLNSVPTLGKHKGEAALTGIPGQIPSLKFIPPGCVFAPRCDLAVDRCRLERPPIEITDDSRRIRCHRWREIKNGEISLIYDKQPSAQSPILDPKTILHVDDLVVSYPVSTKGHRLALRQNRYFNAVDGVSLKVGKSHTLGIVGESGSGKSSLALAIMGLVDSVTGEINLLDLKLPQELGQRDRDILRNLQMIFQTLDEAFSPYLSVEEILSRPLMNLLGLKKNAALKRVAELLELVRLPSEYASRYPRQLSGGEKQRVAIAQAFAVNPALLIADEPVSALDVSVQAQILNLLKDLQDQLGLTMLFISHDLPVIRQMCDRVAIMRHGKILETAESETFFEHPQDPYSRELLDLMPRFDSIYEPESESLTIN
jgi:peptide/nickel transport system ATP-binding protein